MNLSAALAKLQDQATSPGELSEILVHFSAEYTKQSLELQAILSSKATKWVDVRTKVGSDRQADKIWDSTAEGISEMGLRLQLRALEKLMSAIRSHLRVREVESRNQF